MGDTIFFLYSVVQIKEISQDEDINEQYQFFLYDFITSCDRNFLFLSLVRVLSLVIKVLQAHPNIKIQNS